MAKVQKTELGVDHVMSLLCGLMVATLGMVLVIVALDGAELIPRMLLRDEVTYSATMAVKTLLFGQMMTFAGGCFIYMFYRR